MRILIHNVDATIKRRELRQLAMKHTGVVTRSLRWLLPRITVQLFQLDRVTSGEPDKRCVVEMKSRRTRKVMVTALSRDWLTAMKAALQLASRRLSELWPSPAATLLPVRLRTLTLRPARPTNR